MAKESLSTQLNELYTLLQSENDALIHNHGEKIEEIVAEKQEMAKLLERYDLNEVNREDYEVISLIRKIQSLQETNLMLTKQAMNYTDTFLSAIQKEAQKDVTYSKERNDKDAGSSGLLNRSL